MTFVFFFSSRRRHTRCLSDWSSDVCSSDLDWLKRPGAPTVLHDVVVAVEQDGGRSRALQPVAVDVRMHAGNLQDLDVLHEIGRASCRERVYISEGVVGV